MKRDRAGQWRVRISGNWRVLNGKTGVSANIALALEELGWGTADHWMGMQASYELALARRSRQSAKRRAEASHA